jgi:lipoate-protein ligase A
MKPCLTIQKSSKSSNPYELTSGIQFPNNGDRKSMHIDSRVLKEVGDNRSYYFLVYEPTRTEVILGRACKEDDDVRVEHCERDNIPILRRAGGGGTVVLSQGIIVISIAGISGIEFHLKEHMIAINERIISALLSLGVKDLSIKGISDIAIEDRKILGSSLYRRKDIVLYQGALLVDPDMCIFDRYLKHPKREPDYRRGRHHRDFITSLYNEGYGIPKSKLVEAIEAKLSQDPPWTSLMQER